MLFLTQSDFPGVNFENRWPIPGQEAEIIESDIPFFDRSNRSKPIKLLDNLASRPERATAALTCRTRTTLRSPCVRDSGKRRPATNTQRKPGKRAGQSPGRLAQPHHSEIAAAAQRVSTGSAPLRPHRRTHLRARGARMGKANRGPWRADHAVFPLYYQRAPTVIRGARIQPLGSRLLADRRKSEVPHQAAKPVDLVVDPASAQRVPGDRLMRRHHIDAEFLF